MNRALSRFGILLLLVLVVIAAAQVWAQAAFAQDFDVPTEVTPEASPPTTVVTVQEGGTANVIEDDPDPLAPLALIISGVAGLMIYISPVITMFVSKIPGVPDWLDEAIQYAVFVVLSYISLVSVPTGIDILALAGYENYNVTFAVLLTAFGMALPSYVLKALFVYVRAGRVVPPVQPARE